jgi:hypothetical protein
LTNYINIIKDFLVKKQNNFYYFFVFNIRHDLLFIEKSEKPYKLTKYQFVH